MASTIWRQQRKAAEEAGREDAESGENNRDRYAVKGRDVMEAYDNGFRERKAEIERQQEALDHPLRQISREADALAYRTDDSDVMELARLVERMADYLADKEDRT